MKTETKKSDREGSRKQGSTEEKAHLGTEGSETNMF
jgi:hypothetical protein